jgi:hypothetical protein
MSMENKRDAAIIGFVIVAIIGVFLFQNSNLTGEASRNVEYVVELEEDEYIFRTGERKIIEDVAVTLVEVTEGNEVIVEVNGVRKSVNEYGGRSISNVQIESISVSDVGAHLRVINFGKRQTTCIDSDLGDIYLRGKCDDRFYPEGVEDFCDFKDLKEYNCGYDEVVDEIHCLKHVVSCSDGCSNGACVSG